jgi:GAF domain-containing protein
VTSGISAKGKALGAIVSEGGVQPNRAPAPRANGTAGNGTKPRGGPKAGHDAKEAGIVDTPESSGGTIAADNSHPALASSFRTLILGIDYDGRIVQHDRNAPQILAREPEELLGAHLSDLATGGAQGNPGLENSQAARSADGVAAVGGLLEALRADREGSAMLTIYTRDDYQAEAVVTVHPMRAGGTSLAALALLRIPAPRSERFVDPALMRRQMLDDTFTRIGDALDIDHLASELIDALVPHFCNAGDLLLLESLIGDDELPSHGPDGSLPLRRIALLHDGKDPAWEAAFPTGEILRFPASSPYFRCMDTGAPVLESTISESQARSIAKAWRRKPVGKLLSGASMLMLPLIARGTMLGFFACTRQEGFRRFDAYDVEIGMDFAARAAVFIDNARRYSREHATALTLQRSMLPTGLSYPSSVEVKHRYLPGSKLIEVGGDWYESIALPGGRVALVVGDVAGHGVRAAVTMGRLRTAIHTLAMLELAPAESLQQLDELMHTLGEREPHFATCAYAVYDAVSGECEIAVAGHLPPLLVHPNGSNELLDVPPAPPLGIGDGEEIESRLFKIEDGSLFVLYTDGLVENKGQDISDGLARLQGIFGEGSPTRPLEDLCKATLDGVYSDHQRDDIAVLIARLRRLPEDRYESWTFAPKLTSVREARAVLAEPMKRWDLEDLIPTTELLVSELVTNAVKYSRGDVTLRLVNEKALFCEVLDSSGALPRLRQANGDDENGRGLQVVRQLSQRWGARRTATGKVVWCEQPLPGGPGPLDDIPPLH